MLTLAQAFDELAAITAPGKTYTTKQLMDLAAQVSSDQYIGAMIEQGADIRVIDKTNPRAKKRPATRACKTPGSVRCATRVGAARWERAGDGCREVSAVRRHADRSCR